MLLEYRIVNVMNECDASMKIDRWGGPSRSSSLKTRKAMVTTRIMSAAQNREKDATLANYCCLQPTTSKPVSLPNQSRSMEPTRRRDPKK